MPQTKEGVEMWRRFWRGVHQPPPEAWAHPDPSVRAAARDSYREARAADAPPK